MHSDIYLSYVNEQVAREDARKESLERRGLALVTASGAIVTLLFALAALTIKSSSYTLPHSSKVLLIAAVAAFFAAALCAIGTNYPFKYEEPLPEELRAAIRERWSDPETEVARNAALTQVKVWKSAREKNGKKAGWLLAGIVGQLVGVFLVAAAVALALAL